MLKLNTFFVALLLKTLFLVVKQQKSLIFITTEIFNHLRILSKKAIVRLNRQTHYIAFFQ